MLKLTVLGCGTPYPRPDDPCSGYLIQTDASNLWIDCGGGTFAALQRYIEPSEISALWISHLHPDHSADLLSIFNWQVNDPDAPRLNIFGPPGWATRLAAMLPGYAADASVRNAFKIQDLSDSATFELDDIELAAKLMDHTVPTYGIRVESASGVVAYSADTGPCPALHALANSADLFVCEAGATQPEKGHCTPLQAGTVARYAETKRQLIVHVPDPSDRQQAAETASMTAHCLVEAAHPGLQIEIFNT